MNKCGLIWQLCQLIRIWMIQTFMFSFPIGNYRRSCRDKNLVKIVRRKIIKFIRFYFLVFWINIIGLRFLLKHNATAGVFQRTLQFSQISYPIEHRWSGAKARLKSTVKTMTKRKSSSLLEFFRSVKIFSRVYRPEDFRKSSWN